MSVGAYSGESGAGKTESTKLIINQLIYVSKGNTQLEQQIIQVRHIIFKINISILYTIISQVFPPSGFIYSVDPGN